jgi:hypothetical protein
MTEEFRRNPQNFLDPVGLRVTPPEILSGRDTMTVETINFDAELIDLMYTLDGKPMPPVVYWKLDAGHRARVFVDSSTPKGLYHFVAVRNSGYPDDSRWYPIDVRVMRTAFLLLMIAGIMLFALRKIIVHGEFSPVSGEPPVIS